jgi:hypothetical protein
MDILAAAAVALLLYLVVFKGEKEESRILYAALGAGAVLLGLKLLGIKL